MAMSPPFSQASTKHQRSKTTLAIPHRLFDIQIAKPKPMTHLQPSTVVEFPGHSIEPSGTKLGFSNCPIVQSGLIFPSILSQFNVVQGSSAAEHDGGWVCVLGGS
ncbi:hypothetical protein CCACVL1_19611 [Corchorus capsularis]|uniref:Uncharacterized protein n=1 Tax=Corchorus capsularis TaxID=210143 RepID=A0A1R3HFQ4_COCAP|nr:hypothetical protein CCACVL1_19611 [Corchorus capsularis]